MIPQLYKADIIYKFMGGKLSCLNEIVRKVEPNRNVCLPESSYLCTQIQTSFNLNSKVI